MCVYLFMSVCFLYYQKKTYRTSSKIEFIFFLLGPFQVDAGYDQKQLQNRLRFWSLSTTFLRVSDRNNIFDNHIYNKTIKSNDKWNGRKLYSKSYFQQPSQISKTYIFNPYPIYQNNNSHLTMPIRFYHHKKHFSDFWVACFDCCLLIKRSLCIVENFTQNRCCWQINH